MSMMIYRLCRRRHWQQSRIIHRNSLSLVINWHFKPRERCLCSFAKVRDCHKAYYFRRNCIQLDWKRRNYCWISFCVTTLKMTSLRAISLRSILISGGKVNHRRTIQSLLILSKTKFLSSRSSIRAVTLNWSNRLEEPCKLSIWPVTWRSQMLFILREFSRLDVFVPFFCIWHTTQSPRTNRWRRTWST